MAYAAGDWDGVIYLQGRGRRHEKEIEQLHQRGQGIEALSVGRMACAYYRLGDLGRAEQATLGAGREPGNERMLENRPSSGEVEDMKSGRRLPGRTM